MSSYCDMILANDNGHLNIFSRLEILNWSKFAVFSCEKFKFQQRVPSNRIMMLTFSFFSSVTANATPAPIISKIEHPAITRITTSNFPSQNEEPILLTYIALTKRVGQIDSVRRIANGDDTIMQSFVVMPSSPTSSVISRTSSIAGGFLDVVFEDDEEFGKSLQGEGNRPDEVIKSLWKDVPTKRHEPVKPQKKKKSRLERMQERIFASKSSTSSSSQVENTTTTGRPQKEPPSSIVLGSYDKENRTSHTRSACPPNKRKASRFERNITNAIQSIDRLYDDDENSALGLVDPTAWKEATITKKKNASPSGKKGTRRTPTNSMDTNIDEAVNKMKASLLLDHDDTPDDTTATNTSYSSSSYNPGDESVMLSPDGIAKMIRAQGDNDSLELVPAKLRKDKEPSTGIRRKTTEGANTKMTRSGRCHQNRPKSLPSHSLPSSKVLTSRRTQQKESIFLGALVTFEASSVTSATLEPSTKQVEASSSSCSDVLRSMSQRLQHESQRRQRVTARLKSRSTAT